VRLAATFVKSASGPIGLPGPHARRLAQAVDNMDNMHEGHMRDI